jgi:hypothetical protein
MIRRTLIKGIETYGLGKDILEFIASKGGVIEKAKNFEPAKPYVLRWHKDRYRVENEDYGLEKLFKVMNQYFYYSAITRLGNEPTRKMDYNSMELGDSMIFATLKHRRWKGSKSDLEKLLPGLNLKIEGNK